MGIDLQRKIDRIAGSAICRALSWFTLKKRPKPVNAQNVEKILVILLSEMGSLVLAYPMFRYIKELYPKASIHVLVFKKNKEVLDLLKVVDLENIITIDHSPLTRFTKSCLSALLRLRREKFDVAIDCELFARISSLISFLSGAKIRVGFHPHTQEGLYRGDFINRPVMYNPYYHISKQFLTLVEAVESKSVPTVKRLVSDEPLEAPAIEFGQEQIEKYKNQLLLYTPKIAGKRLVLIYPSGGLLSIRAWPLEYYCRVAKQLLAKGYAVGVIGTKEDKDIARQILNHCRNNSCIDLTGYTKSIKELMILFHVGSLLITNDGGPGQFSAMTPIPAIVFFGPETGALYRSHNPNTIIFQSPLSCSPCITAYNHRKSPCDGDNICLKLIRPEKVLAKALEILQAKKYSPLTEIPSTDKNRPGRRIVALEKQEQLKPRERV
ncbi:MAG: glycosyltransferase family 9 protein [Planctomycetota bacterium]|jgi:ADP-heptose:LPS heptosyltransferase